MAAANVNLILNTQPGNTKSSSAASIRSTYFSRRTYSGNYKNQSNFNTILDRASSTQQQTNPTPAREPQKISASESTTKPRTDDYKKAQQPTQKPKDAPKSETTAKDAEPIKKAVEELDDAPANSTAAIPIDMSALFSTSTESLLAVKDAPTSDLQPVLMTVLPQESNVENQSMLNMLAGNTWRQQMQPQKIAQPIAGNAEPTAMIDEVISTPLQTVETETPTIAMQVPVDVEGASDNAPKIELEADALPQLPSDVETQNIPRGEGKTIEPQLINPNSDQSLEVPTAEKEVAPLQSQSTTILPNSEQKTGIAINDLEAQSAPTEIDGAIQTEVISNDSNLSNVTDAAKNSQPKVMANDIQSPTDQPMIEGESEIQPLATQSAGSQIERQTVAQNEQPIAATNQTEQPQIVESQQPIRTQQTIETTTVETIEVPVEQTGQPTQIRQTQQPNAPLQNVETTAVETPIEETTTPINENQSTTATVEQSTRQQTIEQPTDPTQTQQIFDARNASPAPRETANLNQPTTAQQPVETAEVNPDQPIATQNETTANEIEQPVHRRYHGFAAQQEASDDPLAAWRNREAPLYQVVQDQRMGGTPTLNRNPLAASAMNNQSVTPNVNQPTAGATNVVLNSNAADASNATGTLNVEAPTINQPMLEVSTPNATNAPNVEAAPNDAPQMPNTPNVVQTLENSGAPISNPTAVLSAIEGTSPTAASIEIPAFQTASNAQLAATPINQPTAAPNAINVPNIEMPNANQQSATPNAINVPNIEMPNANQQSAAPNAINVPNIETPNINQQSATPSTVNIPNVETPSVNQQSAIPNTVNIPNINAPNVNQQQTTAPSTVNIPNVETPNVNQNPTTPSASNIPNVETPRINQQSAALNAINIPNVDAPSVNQNPTAPNAINIPNVETPRINQQLAAPNAINVPNVETPSVNQNPTASNAINIPNVETPSVNQQSAAPNAINIPTVETPNVNQQSAAPNAINIPNVETPSNQTTTPTAASAPSNPTQFVNVIENAPQVSSVAQPQQPIETSNRPVNNMPQSFSIFGNELAPGEVVTAPQQTASFDQQSQQQTPNQQQPQQQAAQQQAIQQQTIQQQTIQQQAQVQTQATMTMPEGQASTAQMPTESFAQNFNTPINTPNTPQPAQQPQASATQNTAFAQQLKDDFNVMGQIVEQARLFRTAQNTEMVLQLKPENLGELMLRVSVTAEGTVNASFHSDNAAVRAIIENSLVSLKQELANQGLKVDNVEVYSGLSDGSSLMNGRGRQQNWQQQNRQNAQRVGRVRGGGRIAEGGTATQSVETVQPVAAPAERNVISSDGVDLSV